MLAWDRLCRWKLCDQAAYTALSADALELVGAVWEQLGGCCARLLAHSAFKVGAHAPLYCRCTAWHSDGVEGHCMRAQC